MGKVILFSVDGMRSDGVEKCGNPFVSELKRVSTYTFQAQTVFLSVTLLCHMSLFHSVTPERHGIRKFRQWFHSSNECLPSGFIAINDPLGGYIHKRYNGSKVFF